MAKEEHELVYNIAKKYFVVLSTLNNSIDCMLQNYQY